MAELRWYLVIRRNPDWKWMDAIDGVRSSGRMQALQAAYSRNPVKPSDRIRVERATDAEKVAYAKLKHAERNREIAELRAMLEL